MSNPTSTEYEKYYVPEQSKMAVLATIGLMLSIFGAASVMNDKTFGDGITSGSWSTLIFGLFWVQDRFHFKDSLVWTIVIIEVFCKRNRYIIHT